MSEPSAPERDAGRFYEDFHVGQRIVHPLGRTVLAADNSWFSLLTQNQNPIHIDRHHSEHTPFGKPLVNSCLTLALATGQSVNDLTRNVLANLGWDEVRLPAPLFEGDTLYSESEVLSTRESRSRPEAGIVSVRTRGKNQDGVVVIEFRRTFLIWKRAHAPSTATADPTTPRWRCAAAVQGDTLKSPIHGVDFSGAQEKNGKNPKIWIASWYPGAEEAELESGGDGAGFDRRGLAQKIIDGAGTWVIDFPFGPPAAVAAAAGWNTWWDYVDWCEGDTSPEDLWRALKELGDGDEWKQKREVDRERRTSLSPFNLRLYKQTILGARDVLRLLDGAGRNNVRVLPFHGLPLAHAGQSVVIEGFPGWTLRQSELFQTGYKDKRKHKRVEALEKRRRIVESLCKRGIRISKADASRAIDDVEGDAVDALALLYAARNAKNRLTTSWNEIRTGLEGWFFD